MLIKLVIKMNHINVNFKLFHKTENLFRKIGFLSLKNLFLCTDINNVKNLMLINKEPEIKYIS
jgi:hypothetical protein